MSGRSGGKRRESEKHKVRGEGCRRQSALLCGPGWERRNACLGARVFGRTCYVREQSVAASLNFPARSHPTPRAQPRSEHMPHGLEPHLAASRVTPERLLPGDKALRPQTRRTQPSKHGFGSKQLNPPREVGKNARSRAPAQVVEVCATPSSCTSVSQTGRYLLPRCWARAATQHNSRSQVHGESGRRRLIPKPALGLSRSVFGIQHTCGSCAAGSLHLQCRLLGHFPCSGTPSCQGRRCRPARSVI